MTSSALIAQGQGSIRGTVTDQDFDVPVAAAKVLIVETGQETTSSDQGNYVLGDVRPGRYTLVFSKEGYVNQVRAGVIVTSGQLTDVNVVLAGEFTEMEEFVVQDILGKAPGSEASLLQLRFDAPALEDSISAELMSRAGASDAAAALNLVSGATAQDGKFATVRGLPDRYVSSQMNGVRLPTADEDKRAVELDQFPAAVIESIRVTKSFTPDQQGDASGGAVNVVLKGIPDAPIFQIKSEVSYNSQVRGRNDFLTYTGGGVNTWGHAGTGRGIQYDNLGSNWRGAVGVSTGDAPGSYKWSVAGGNRYEFDNGITIGGYANFFYERDASYDDDGEDNSLWVVNPGDPLTPKTIQGEPVIPGGDFKTSLFDITKGTELVQWGNLGTFGVESENHSATVTYLFTRTTEDTATLAEDTRGKEYFFPGYNPNNPFDPGNLSTNIQAAPYLRTETLEYSERETETLQLSTTHKLPDFMGFVDPELDFTGAHSRADLDQPDKRQFGTTWRADSFNPGFPPFVPPFITPATHFPFKPAATFTLGNLQRIFKKIEQESDQYFSNLKLPFEQWSGDRGYLKFGVFSDDVDRDFDQETFSNFNDFGTFQGEFDQFWSASFPFEPGHPITASDDDIDYKGEEKIFAWYSMMELPLTSTLKVLGGARFESTKIDITNFPEANATWLPPGSSTPVDLEPGTGDADVSLDEDDVLPSIALVYTPTEEWTFRASYSQTIARPTFKELSPVLQSEFLGGPVFIGNPNLQLASLDNYDLRVDYNHEGGLVSASWFYKDLDDPIENVQRIQPFSYTQPVNYPKGKISGVEFEVRQDLGYLTESLTGFSIGGNVTIIDSSVDIPEDEKILLARPGIEAPQNSRDATGAPEHLYNLYTTWDQEEWGSQISLFYTVIGDTLLAGPGTAAGNYVPSIYEVEYGTLNLTVSQRLGDYFGLTFKAKNLTNPTRKSEYRSAFVPGDRTKTKFSSGIDYSISLGGEISF